MAHASENLRGPAKEIRRAENPDDFPEEAKSDSTKSKAIASGKGKVSRSLDQGEWGIELLWEY